MISVTQIIDTFPEKELTEWKIRVGKAKSEAVSQEALAIGSLVDKAIQKEIKSGKRELELKGSTEAITQAVQTCLQGWQIFKQQHPEFVPTITRIQYELTYEDLMGHPDFEREEKGWGFDDLKCASQIRPSHWTQVAGYAWLKQMQFKLGPPAWLGILRLDKVSGQPEYVQLTEPKEIQYEIEVWNHYRALYGHRERVAERNRILKEEEAMNHVS